MKQDRFDVYSNKYCIDCNRPLKQNLVDKNPRARRCYKCFIKHKEAKKKHKKVHHGQKTES